MAELFAASTVSERSDCATNSSLEISDLDPWGWLTATVELRTMGRPTGPIQGGGTVSIPGRRKLLVTDRQICDINRLDNKAYL